MWGGRAGGGETERGAEEEKKKKRSALEVAKNRPPRARARPTILSPSPLTLFLPFPLPQNEFHGGDKPTGFDKRVTHTLHEMVEEEEVVQATEKSVRKRGRKGGGGEGVGVVVVVGSALGGKRGQRRRRSCGLAGPALLPPSLSVRGQGKR